MTDYKHKKKWLNQLQKEKNGIIEGFASLGSAGELRICNS
jgi:hypothetical protein